MQPCGAPINDLSHPCSVSLEAFLFFDFSSSFTMKDSKYIHPPFSSTFSLYFLLSRVITTIPTSPFTHFTHLSEPNINFFLYFFFSCLYHTGEGEVTVYIIFLWRRSKHKPERWRHVYTNQTWNITIKLSAN